MKSLQKEQNSTNLLLWHPICRNKSAITPKWFNSLDTNSNTNSIMLPWTRYKKPWLFNFEISILGQGWVFWGRALFSSPSELSVDQTSRAPVALSSISSHREARTWPSGFASFLLFWLIFSFQWFHRYILLERNYFSDVLKWCKCNIWHPVTFFTCFLQGKKYINFLILSIR